ERESTRDGGTHGLCRERSLRLDHLGAVREHPVVILECDLRLPSDGYDERQSAVPEAVEVQGAIQSGEPGDQLKLCRPGGRVKTQPVSIHLLLLRPHRNGERADQRQRESKSKHCSTPHSYPPTPAS